MVLRSGLDLFSVAIFSLSWDSSKMQQQVDEIEKYKQLAGLEKIKHTIKLARFRCLDLDEIIAQIPSLPALSDASALLYRLEEAKLTTKHYRSIAIALRNLATKGDDLPSQEKGRIDRYLLRLARLLPQTLASQFADEMLEHKRSSRRQIAYSLLRKAGFGGKLAPRLVSMFQKTRDEELLHILVRQVDAVAAVDPRFLLESITEEYWRMRVVEALLQASPTVAKVLASTYPREFVWAVGRREDTSCLEIICQLCAKTEDLDLLSLYAWALGRLRADRKLQVLAGKVNKRLRALEPAGNMSTADNL